MVKFIEVPVKAICYDVVDPILLDAGVQPQNITKDSVISINVNKVVSVLKHINHENTCTIFIDGNGMNMERTGIVTSYSYEKVMDLLTQCNYTV